VRMQVLWPGCTCLTKAPPGFVVAKLQTSLNATVTIPSAMWAPRRGGAFGGNVGGTTSVATADCGRGCGILSAGAGVLPDDAVGRHPTVPGSCRGP
jgi:hypothetical protein